MERDTIKEFFEKKAKEERQSELLPSLERRPPPEVRPLREKQRVNKFKQNAIIWLGAITAAALLIYGGKMIFDRFTYITENSSANIVAEVGKVIAIPQDETPVVSTITSLDGLSGQAFFADARLGDKVISFERAKKAILYRPQSGKVINIANLK